MFTFNHYNINVSDMDKSLAFYDAALGLKTTRRIDADGFTIVFVGDGSSDFKLELTYLKDRTDKYDLGECEYHLALTADDIDAAFAKHSDMGVVCYNNESLGVYFIEDPDGYWIEIMPKR